MTLGENEFLCDEALVNAAFKRAVLLTKQKQDRGETFTSLEQLFMRYMQLHHMLAELMGPVGPTETFDSQMKTFDINSFPEFKKIFHHIHAARHIKLGKGEDFTPLEDAWQRYFDECSKAGFKIHKAMKRNRQ